MFKEHSGRQAYVFRLSCLFPGFVVSKEIVRILEHAWMVLGFTQAI